MTDFKVGDRVGAKAPVREQYARFGNTNPLYGHVIDVRGQSLVWVRGPEGSEWGLPAWELEHID